MSASMANGGWGDEEAEKEFLAEGAEKSQWIRCNYRYRASLTRTPDSLFWLSRAQRRKDAENISGALLAAARYNPRMCLLSRRTFWLSVALLLAVVVAGVWFM